jgi:hypothetical protein
MLAERPPSTIQKQPWPPIGPPLTNGTSRLPSVGFSGAGFLGCYHLGVADCLVKHGILLGPIETTSPTDSSSSPILLGASAGAIVAASIYAGIRAEDGMNIVFEIRRRVKEQGGKLDVLYPGISLVDHVWDLMFPAIQEAVGNDEERLLRRIGGSNRLRIALTCRSKYSSFSSPWTPAALVPANLVLARTQKIINKEASHISSAYCYVDSYRSIADVVSACILSSYIPGLTGPARGVDDSTHKAVRNATTTILQILQVGAVKDGATGKPLSLSDVSAEDKTGNETTYEMPSTSRTEPFWDGGLSCVWPTVDHSTIIVCPIRARYEPNPAIYPELQHNGTSNSCKSNIEEDAKDGFFNGALERKIKAIFARRSDIITASFHGKKVPIASDNAETIGRMIFSSSEDILQERFYRGYDDATRFLKEQGMLKVYSIPNK